MADTTNSLLKVAVIACGGTIGSVSRDSLDVIDYPEQGEKVPLATLLARVPDAQRVADIRGVDFRAVSSSAIGPAEWLELRALMAQFAQQGARGIVILHGTGTLEETAFFLHLTWSQAVPVVLTGAQLTQLQPDATAYMESDKLPCTFSLPASSGGIFQVFCGDAELLARQRATGESAYPGSTTETDTVGMKSFEMNVGPPMTSGSYAEVDALTSNGTFQTYESVTRRWEHRFDQRIRSNERGR